jgi:hypothetical protein
MFPRLAASASGRVKPLGVRVEKRCYDTRPAFAIICSGSFGGRSRPNERISLEEVPKSVIMNNSDAGRVLASL